LKIDIEGMDTVCLKALLDFEQKPDYVSIESEMMMFSKLVEELSLFTQLGYVRFKAVHQCGVSRQREPNPSKEGHYAGYQFEAGSSGLFGSDLPGEWKTHEQILSEYKTIFFLYKHFGNYGKLGKHFAGKVIKKALSILLRRTIPGWYDTHAQHVSALASSHVQ
jgi:hypothetical protein